jgi:hypothetical protein
VDYDDIVIGSGLTALATVLGLPSKRRVLVIGGPEPGHSEHYDASRTVPCAYLGFGGLGNFWHGVIPTGVNAGIDHGSSEDFARLITYFYPGLDLEERLDRPFLFVPWRAIRPRAAWPRLKAERGNRLSLSPELAVRFVRGEGSVQVQTNATIYRASRLWVCAGALHTPALLDRSLDTVVSRPTVSDHVLCYLGQIDRAAHPDIAPPTVQRNRHGMWLKVRHNESSTALCTLRPARFAYARLDHGIEQRAVFGLPTGRAVAKILRGASPGLLAEAFYNRFGVFAAARFQSVYAQLIIRDAHWLGRGGHALTMRHDVIRATTDAVRSQIAWPQLTPSRRPDIFIPAIHLHHSVEREALLRMGINTPQAPVQVLDASVHGEIGPEHHSFRLMVAAFVRARRTVGACK